MLPLVVDRPLARIRTFGVLADDAVLMLRSGRNPPCPGHSPASNHCAIHSLTFRSIRRTAGRATPHGGLGNGPTSRAASSKWCSAGLGIARLVWCSRPVRGQARRPLRAYAHSVASSTIPAALRNHSMMNSSRCVGNAPSGQSHRPHTVDCR